MNNQVNVGNNNSQEIVENSPDKRMKKIINNSFFIRVLMVLCVGIISSLLTWMFLNHRYQAELRSNRIQINQLKDQINKLAPQQSVIGKNQFPPEVIESQKDNIFYVLPKELQVIEKSVPITPNSGYIIVNSILSNKKDRIVYSEISDCIGLKNNPDYSNNGECDWKYRIYVKSLPSGEPERLYGYPEDKLTLIDFLIPKVSAGGCPLVYLPIGWSKNDKKIILQSVNPTSCGAGGGTTKYLFASVNSEGGSIEGISNGSTKFYDNFGKVIVVGESENSPRICGPINQRNNGKMLFLNTETKENIKTIEESNSDYSLGEFSTDKTQIEYFRRPAPEKNECAEIDWSSQGEKRLIVLP